MVKLPILSKLFMQKHNEMIVEWIVTFISLKE